ncbi:hypothetical protein CC80DRAFT_553207 [Byssothecium circinans]|uniref:Uncharacterized protein n=1 Tax=Byssothecium circinans TaxID=147558 RepID=A0A6A5TFG4_9PLEO|nr:hypothetical protein CC80DRAFT_553207 [Byssothecium circinans]
MFYPWTYLLDLSGELLDLNYKHHIDIKGGYIYDFSTEKLCASNVKVIDLIVFLVGKAPLKCVTWHFRRILYTFCAASMESRNLPGLGILTSSFIIFHGNLISSHNAIAFDSWLGILPDSLSWTKDFNEIYFRHHRGLSVLPNPDQLPALTYARGFARLLSTVASPQFQSV